MLMADSIDRLNHIWDSFYKRFRAKGSVVGSEFQYLGMAIKVDRAARRVTVNQHGYLTRILEKFDMARCNGRLNAMDSGLRLRRRKQDEPKADIEVYRQAIGCLLYAALGSRPDIAYAVGVLGPYAADPGISHMQAVQHLFRYLKRTVDHELPIYDPERAPAPAHQNPVVAYADADFGGDVDDAKSTSGYLIYAHGSLVDWKSKKQTIVAQSTMEAELIASATALRTVNWITGFLTEIGIDNGIGGSPLLFKDNQACMTVLTSGNFKSDNRHLRVRYYSIYESIALGTLAIEHTAGDEMLVDALTKPLDGTKNRLFVSRLGMV
jgi:hypothetical protein